MSQLLEAIMLICFGCSWPMNLIKNIKCKTAKSMSLPFILLITSGYIAGITAKLVSHQINYVLIVYILNIIIVTMNIAVYFYNRSLDKKASAGENNNNEAKKQPFPKHKEVYILHTETN